MIYKTIDNFYNWLITMAKKDCNELKISNCEDFLNEYHNIISGLLKKREVMKENVKCKQLNHNSIERLKIIVEVTKEEYNAMADSSDEEKDFIYFNNLLGWYQAIPDETDMFIDSLLSKQ